MGRPGREKPRAEQSGQITRRNEKEKKAGRAVANP